MRPLIILALLAGATSLSAQEVQIYGHRGSSDLTELESTEGLGLATRFPLLEWLDLQIAFSFRSGTSGGVEEVCSQWQPRWQCYAEPVFFDSSLQEAAAALVPRLLETDYVRLSAGGGMSLNRLYVSGTGESGRPIAINMPGGAQRGFLALADVALSPGRRSQFSLVAGAKIHWADIDGCTAGNPDIPVVERYCGFYTFKEVRAGVAFSF